MRYYEPDVVTSSLFDKVREERFEGLEGARIKLIMDMKPKIDKLRGTMVFASIKTTNEVEKYLTEQVSGYDYFVFINSLVWNLANEKDKKRILSHELCHCFVEPEKGNYKIIRHDIEDFHAELELNKDDPMWGQALSTIAMVKLEQEKADA